MTQFDQEIKDKLNSKTYSYKPQAWSAFKRHSGMPLMSAGAKASLIGGIAAALVGVVLFIVLPRPVDSVSDTTTVSNEPNAVELILTDTASPVAVPETVTSTEPVVAAVPSHKPKASAQNPAQPVTTEQPQTSTEAPSQSKPAVQQPSYYGRPLEILVDTISSNDFPDYKAKPADMLP